MSLQREIIEALGVKPVIDPQQEVRVSVDFLKSYLKANPFLKPWCSASAADKTPR